MTVVPPPERLIHLGFVQEDLPGLKLQEPVGCPRCEKGFKGRFAILETMPLNEPLRRVIVEGGSALDIRKTALGQGMITLRRCGILNCIRGRTSLEEVLRATVGD
jgi:type IV pilus assembly protein PilB